MSEGGKKTLVFGASQNTARYSNIAVHRLQAHDQEVVAIGGREGHINDTEILTGTPALDGIHTITLYMGKKRQEEYADYLLSLNPKRIVFNPGAENPDLYMKAKNIGIEVLNACTLVMLATGQY